MGYETLIGKLRSFDLVVTVPDSTLQPFYRSLNCTTVATEQEAVGIAAGVALAGKRAAVLIQNSGLARTANDICSLLQLYHLPVLFVIGWRGHPEINDAEEHTILGPRTPTFLRCIGLPFVVLQGNGSDELAISRCFRQFTRGNSVALLIVPKKKEFTYVAHEKCGCADYRDPIPELAKDSL